MHAFFYVFLSIRRGNVPNDSVACQRLFSGKAMRKHSPDRDRLPMERRKICVEKARFAVAVHSKLLRLNDSKQPGTVFYIFGMRKVSLIMKLRDKTDSKKTGMQLPVRTCLTPWAA